MRPSFHRELDRYVEALFAVRALVSGDAPRANCEHSAAKRPGRAAAIRALYAPLVAVQADLERAIDLDDEGVQFLFCERAGFSDALYLLFLFPDGGAGVTDERILAIFGSYLSDGDGEPVIPSDGAELAAQIGALPAALSDKSALLYAFHNYRALHDRVREIADTAAAVLDAHSAETAPLLDGTAAFWAEKLTAPDDLRRTFSELQVPLAIDGADIALYPTLFRPNGLSLMECDGVLHIYWGVLVHELLKDPDEGISPAQMQEILKALSDKTKFEILSLLRTERPYGSQLAERLGLTPATISHHLSQLASLGLIRLVKEGGRYYCEPDRAAIAAFVEALGGALPR